MRKTLLGVAMVFCMLFAMGTGVFAADFSDVKSNDWFIEDLTDAANAGIAKGYEDGTFRPNEKVNRAEMVAMFNRALDIKYCLLYTSRCV